jgi:hypothetical protein
MVCVMYGNCSLLLQYGRLFSWLAVVVKNDASDSAGDKDFHCNSITVELEMMTHLVCVITLEHF